MEPWGITQVREGEATSHIRGIWWPTSASEQLSTATCVRCQLLLFLSWSVPQVQRADRKGKHTKNVCLSVYVTGADSFIIMHITHMHIHLKLILQEVMDNTCVGLLCLMKVLVSWCQLLKLKLYCTRCVSPKFWHFLKVVKRIMAMTGKCKFLRNFWLKRSLFCKILL